MIKPGSSKWISIVAVAFVIATAVLSPWSASANAGAGTVADACIAIDESRDMLTPRDREAAILLVSRQFEREGQPVAPAGCSSPYTLTHIRLGNTLVVTLSGAMGKREGTARGMDDLLPLYSQMVRSIVTGRPMTGMQVVDRGNVTAAQTAAPSRVRFESFHYVRLGYGSIRREGGGSALGFGSRFELDSMGIDVSYFNFQMNSGGPTVGSLVKLEALHFINPVANASAYFGAGLSYGSTGAGRREFTQSLSGRWRGTGLHGELSVGYEFARASSLRMFVQADATLPFYKATFQESSPLIAPRITERRFMPAVTVSLGFGWAKGRALR